MMIGYDNCTLINYDSVNLKGYVTVTIVYTILCD